MKRFIHVAFALVGSVGLFAGVPAAAQDAATTDAATTDAATTDASDSAADASATSDSAAVGEGVASEDGADSGGETGAADDSGIDLQTAEEEYDLRVRGLEGKINDLKEQIFRSKAKLTLLTQAVTEGGLGQGAKATIIHRNDMGAFFLLTEVNYFLDAAPLWQDVDEEGDRLTAITDHVIWSGNIVEGSHTLTVTMVYRGSGSGVFSYLEGYTFRLKDSVAFSAEPGKVIIIESIGFEQGGMFAELTDRPSIRFDTKVDVNQGALEE